MSQYPPTHPPLLSLMATLRISWNSDTVRPKPSATSLKASHSSYTQDLGTVHGINARNQTQTDPYLTYMRYRLHGSMRAVSGHLRLRKVMKSGGSCALPMVCPILWPAPYPSCCSRERQPDRTGETALICMGHRTKETFRDPAYISVTSGMKWCLDESKVVAMGRSAAG